MSTPKRLFRYYNQPQLKDHLQWEYFLDKSNKVENFYFLKRRKTAYTMLRTSKEDIILDIGCAEGYDVHQLSLRVGFIVGVDLSLPALKKAKKFFCVNISNSDFILCDAQQLPLRNDSFNKILCLEVLEHLPSPKLALSEIRRVCKQAAVISTPLIPKWVRSRSGDKTIDEWMHISTYKTAKDLKKDLLNARFNKIEQRFYLIYFPKHWAILSKVPGGFIIANFFESMLHHISTLPWLGVIVKCQK